MAPIYAVLVCILIVFSIWALLSIWAKPRRKPLVFMTSSGPSTAPKPDQTEKTESVKIDPESLARRIEHLRDLIVKRVHQGDYWYKIFTFIETAYGRAVAVTLLGELFVEWMTYQDKLIERQREVFRERDRVRFRNMPTHVKVEHFQKTRAASQFALREGELKLYTSIRRNAFNAKYT